ncbi:hypothetical protein [Gordonia sp. (in: high G+C Gram-positive bacteria)]|uniref:hypothetical protein n=1 Tax=Gordonia sp. (in: high G+C Gram-positive bacteria) TaxID=84139 RepID=UPI0035275216
MTRDLAGLTPSFDQDGVGWSFEYLGNGYIALGILPLSESDGISGFLVGNGFHGAETDEEAATAAVAELVQDQLAGHHHVQWPVPEGGSVPLHPELRGGVAVWTNRGGVHCEIGRLNPSK